jgi:hypothetical protein
MMPVAPFEVISGRVAFDVENHEWVMFVEDRFVPMGHLYEAVNRELERQNLPKLAVGDEITVTVRRNGTRNAAE